MEHLRASNHPLGAYDIARLSRQNGSPLAPNQVYRILDRLIDRGQVWRVELLSAYMPAQEGLGALAVCKECRTATSFDAGNTGSDLVELCHANGFAPAASIIEVSGLCPECSARRGGAAPFKRSHGFAILFALLSLGGGPELAGVGGALTEPALAQREAEKNGAVWLADAAPT